MAKRTQIPKSVRFEVFKRDKFTCQYCGASAPDVILEVDHIKPVAKGGTNDILNLVTACRDCNRGKTDKELSDNSSVAIQKQQLDLMQERREQLGMMLQWRSELEKEIEEEIDYIEGIFINRTRAGFNANGRNGIRVLIKRFGFNEVIESTDISLDKYYRRDSDWENAFKKIGGICYNRKKARDGDA